MIRRLVADPQSAEDLVQETFLRAHRSLHTLDTNRPEWPWLAAIAKRLCIDQWRWSDPSSDPLPEHDDFFDAEDGSCGKDLADIFVAQEHRVLLEETLGSLHPRHRRLLVLKYIDGWRHKDILAFEGTTSEALRAALLRARQSFKRRYEAAARERGLLGLAPVLGRVGTFVGDLRQRAQQAGDWIQRAVGGGVFEAATSGLASPIASGLIVLATLSGVVATASPTSATAASTTEPAVFRQATSPSAVGSSALPASSEPTTSNAVQPTANAGGANLADPPASPESASPTPADPTGSPPAGPVTASDQVSGGTAAAQQQTYDVAPVQPGDVTDPNQNVARPEDAHSSSIVFSPASDQTVFVSGRNAQCATTPGACPAVLYLSTDGGATWTRLPAQGFDGDQILLPPAYGAGDNRIFAMTPAGVLQVSSDGGASFGPAATGAPQERGAMTISPTFDQGDPRILIGTQASLMQYMDDTKTIGPAPYSALPGSLDPLFASDGTLFVGGRQADQSGRLGSTVFRCDQAVCNAARISDSPETPHIRLSPTFADGGPVYAFTSRSAFASTDGGHTFTSLATPVQQSSLVDLAVGNGNLYAAAYDPTLPPDVGLYISSDHGTSWVKVANPLFDSGVLKVRASGSRVLAGLAAGGVACSSDAGLTWAARC